MIESQIVVDLYPQIQVPKGKPETIGNLDTGIIY